MAAVAQGALSAQDLNRNRLQFRFTMFKKHVSGATDDNWIQLGYQALKDFWKLDYCSHLVWQAEICPTTGREHLQGFIRFKTRRRGNWFLKRFAPHKLSLYGADCSVEANYKYCTKEDEKNKRVEGWKPEALGGPFTGAQAPKRGQRTDLDACIEDIEAGKGVNDVLIEHPKVGIKYHNGIRSLVTAHKASKLPRSRPNDLIYLFGPTSSGKSKLAMDWFRDIPCYVAPWTPWFDNYNGEIGLLIDEFDRGRYDYRNMLSICDSGTTQVPVKGGFVYGEWQCTVFTSNIAPSNIYDDEARGSNVDKWSIVMRDAVDPNDPPIVDWNPDNTARRPSPLERRFLDNGRIIYCSGYYNRRAKDWETESKRWKLVYHPISSPNKRPRWVRITDPAKVMRDEDNVDWEGFDYAATETDLVEQQQQPPLGEVDLTQLASDYVDALESDGFGKQDMVDEPPAKVFTPPDWGDWTDDEEEKCVLHDLKNCLVCAALGL